MASGSYLILIKSIIKSNDSKTKQIFGQDFQRKID